MNLNYLNTKIAESPFSNEEIAEIIDVSRSTLFNYKAERKDIPVKKLDKLIKLLSLDVQELFK